MIVSRYWLSEFVDLANIDNKTLEGIFNSTGLELDALELLDIPSGVVLGFIKGVKKHPNSEKLSLCEVLLNDGKSQEVVCGASNVEPGIYVAIALEGTKLGDITIAPRNIQGITSCGMICSAQELGLGKLNDGIMHLDESIGELVLGKSLREYPLFCDTLFDIDITPNKGDCLSLMGLARDLYATSNLALKPLQAPRELDNAPGIGRILSLQGGGFATKFCFKVLSLKSEFKLNLKQQLRLLQLDSLDKSPAQSLINYATHASGVVITGYDLGSICKDCEREEDAKVSLKLKALDNGACAVFCEEELLGVAGIKAPKLQSDASLLLLEASFTPGEVISNAAKDYKGAEVFRTSRGSEPDLALGMNYLLKEGDESFAPYAGMSWVNNEVRPRSILFSAAEISQIIGLELDKNEVANMLKRFGIDLSASGELLNAQIPCHRADLKNAADLAEEILRVIRIEKVEARPLVFAEKPRENETLLNWRHARKLRESLAAAGYFESLSYAMASSQFLAKFGFAQVKTRLINPISSELDALRTTLLAHLVQAASFNFKNGQESVRLFEYGSCFEEDSKEVKKLAIFASGYKEAPSIKNHAKPELIGFYELLSTLRDLLGEFELRENKSYCFLSEYESVDIYVKGVRVGFAGRLDPLFEDEMDLRPSYVAELLFSLLPRERAKMQEFSSLPNISRDLSLLVPKTLGIEPIKAEIFKLALEHLKEVEAIDIYEDEKLGNNISLTLRLTFSSSEQLKDEDINSYMASVLACLETELGLELR